MQTPRYWRCQNLEKSLERSYVHIVEWKRQAACNKNSIAIGGYVSSFECKWFFNMVCILYLLTISLSEPELGRRLHVLNSCMSSYSDIILFGRWLNIHQSGPLWREWVTGQILKFYSSTRFHLALFLVATMWPISLFSYP